MERLPGAVQQCKGTAAATKALSKQRQEKSVESDAVFALARLLVCVSALLLLIVVVVCNSLWKLIMRSR